MHVKILGPMTKQAELLLQNTAIALKKLKVKAEFEKVSEFQKVVAYGVMAFPALVIDEKLVAVGSTLSVDEAMTLIKKLLKYTAPCEMCGVFFCFENILINVKFM